MSLTWCQHFQICHTAVNIMIIKWLWKYFFLSQPRSLTKILSMPVELCLGTRTLFPSLSSGLLLHLDLGCRYWGRWTERWQTSKLFHLLTSFLTSHFYTPPLPKRKSKLLPSFFATRLTAPTTHRHKPVSLLSPAWALDSDFSNSREQKRLLCQEQALPLSAEIWKRFHYTFYAQFQDLRVWFKMLLFSINKPQLPHDRKKPLSETQRLVPHKPLFPLPSSSRQLIFRKNDSF